MYVGGGGIVGFEAKDEQLKSWPGQSTIIRVCRGLVHMAHLKWFEFSPLPLCCFFWTRNFAQNRLSSPRCRSQCWPALD